MRKLSFQWRITLMTALLLALTCVVLNLLLYRSGIYYFDTLDDYVVEYTGGRIPEGEASEDVVIIDMTPEEFESFSVRFTEELIAAKEKFGEKSWLITAVTPLLGGVVAYFVCGRSLKPLREFSSQAEQVQAKNLTATRLNEDTVPEFRTLSQSINQSLELAFRRICPRKKQFVGKPPMNCVRLWRSCRPDWIYIKKKHIRICGRPTRRSPCSPSRRNVFPIWSKRCWI